MLIGWQGRLLRIKGLVYPLISLFPFSSFLIKQFISSETPPPSSVRSPTSNAQFYPAQSIHLSRQDTCSSSPLISQFRPTYYNPFRCIFIHHVSTPLSSISHYWDYFGCTQTGGGVDSVLIAHAPHLVTLGPVPCHILLAHFENRVTCR